MQKCSNCKTEFDVSDVRDEYNETFDGESDYDEEHGGAICANCAMPDRESNMNLGAAIQMMNGDLDYDDDFVQKWL
ncbi:hypothetical protein ACFFR3_03340 [Nonomuraea salmonea]|uniref:Uncharacterized protein n=1 Tax=Nonomuraea salmonea TaxID=46181 RepID=A0ABV5NE14_9ACTN